MTKQFELDHVFILTSVGAPEAEKLVEFGLVEGPPNTHPGQGTANRRFFFKNMMLELLWVADAAESQTSDLSVLWRRDQQPGASPFGICLRPAADTPTEQTPFPGWRYTPSYLPEPWYIWVGENSEALTEPFMFYLYFAQLKDNSPDGGHGHGLQTVTRLTIFGCDRNASQTIVSTLAETDGIEFRPAPDSLMELGFNDETQGQTMDFRPHLPLRLCW
ncbi:MAG: VOC family protein [Cyanobacteria bacterium P01_C01_bin.118]